MKCTHDCSGSHEFLNDYCSDMIYSSMIRSNALLIVGYFSSEVPAITYSSLACYAKSPTAQGAFWPISGLVPRLC